MIALIEGNAGLRQRRDELRRLIEAAGQRLILILDGQPPSITHLQALQQLAELLAP